MAPVVVPVERAERRASMMVSLEVVPGEAFVATSSTSGTVTGAAQVGAVLDNGVTVMVVDDRPVVAMLGDAPLWRPLGSGARGEDVTRLQEFLITTGHLSGPATDRFGPATTAGVRSFAQSIGLPRSTTVFDPAWVVWVGDSPLPVAHVDAPVGATLAAGDPVVTGPAAAGAVAVAEPQGGLVADLGDDPELVVGGAVVPYVPGSGAITDPEHVAALVGALGMVEQGAGQIRAAQGHGVAVLPASAVVSGEGGLVCIFPDESSPPVAVTVVGGGGATVQVPLDAGLTTVLANPHQLAGLPACQG
ncbi:peptidoglycan-binding protein [Xylanimonas allomyrinae]|uniref:Peptidoglycan-binding protein n=1 Tax=Xylanimonas allomyrinae TaxID=2509459 RepID=A0A4P6ERK5_9MICO|nr:peptidoglycan-binding domain-containing protein [Xylanimonas allomyrinae]QAY63007.1 peptidoglycan-binding protein [Xylanimonas allomyrinae]